MTAVFIKILNMSINAGWLVLAVIVLRLLLRKAPKAIHVFMWGLVGIRLICPFSFESVLSLIPSTEPVSRYAAYSAFSAVDDGFEKIYSSAETIVSKSSVPEIGASADPMRVILLVACAVWITGIAVMVAYAAVSYLRILGRVREAVPNTDNTYVCDQIETPFILGVFRPRIYLPTNVGGDDIGFVIAHERAHLKRYDHVWKPLGFLLLAVYWFNPLVWVSYVLLCRDIELACDEKVIKTMGESVKKPYSMALINCSSPRSIVSSCPLAFGETGVKKRISSVLNYKKPAFWIIVVSVVAVALSAVCFLTDPASVRLKNIEGCSLSRMAEEAVSVWSSDGEEYSFAGAVGRDLLKELLEIKISGKETSSDRDGIGGISHTLVLQNDEDTQDVLSSYLKGVYVHFDSDFTTVWVDTGEASTLGHRINEPERARRVYEAIVNADNAINDSDVEEHDGVQTYETTLSYAGYAEGKELFTGMCNSDKMYTDAVRHLPIYKFESEKELDMFGKSGNGIFVTDSGLEEITSFNEATERYDGDFFADNSLLLVYVSANNCTHRFKVKNVLRDGGSLCVQVEETTNAEAVDTAMAGWFITVTVRDEVIAECTELDAVLCTDMN